MRHMQPQPDASLNASKTLDESEVRRFAAIASEWWDERGKFRPLHKIGPARLSFIRERLGDHFFLPARDLKPFSSLRILDIGCGGGLVCEPLARLGAAVTGIDPAAANVEAAKLHAAPQGLQIEYRTARIEDLASEGASFDAVLCLEVVEHVPDVGAFLKTCASVVRPGGIMVLSTLNRTLKAFALAIVGAEYVLRWLPAGTHQWDRFVTPRELEQYLVSAGLTVGSTAGMVYSPLTDRWTLSSDTDVNYLLSASKPPA